MSDQADQIAQRIVDLIVSGDEQAAVSYVDANQGNWSAGQLLDIYNAIGDMPDSNMVSPWIAFPRGSAAEKRLSSMYEAGNTDLAGFALDKMKQGVSWSPDFDGNGIVDASERTAVEKAKASYSKEAQKQSNISKEAADKQANQAETATSTLGSLVPANVLSAFGGKQPDQAQVQDMIQRWNEMMPADSQIGTTEELYKALESNSATAQLVIVGAAQGDDAEPSWTVRLADGTTATVHYGQFANFVDATHGQYTSKELTRMVRMADALGMSEARGDGTKEVVWQPVAWMAATLGYDPNTKVVTQQRSAGGMRQQTVDNERNVNSNAFATNVTNLQNSLVKYNQNLKSYNGNVYLAVLATVDPALAGRVSTSKTISPADAHAANQILYRAGMVQGTSLVDKQGYATGEGLLFDPNTATAGGGSGGGGGGGYTRTLPDPVAVKQAAKDMYKNLFAADPTDAEVEQLANQVTGVIRSAPQNQNVDVSARLRDMIEGNALYQELYGKMSKGMTESEYQGQFRAMGQQLLGNQALDPSVVRSGMRTGDMQTTAGAILADKRNTNNSNLMGRLAAAAQAVQEMT